MATWKVSPVLDVLRSWGTYDQLSLSRLSHKLVLLLALAKAPRASEIRMLSALHMQQKPDGIILSLLEPTKTQHHGTLKEFFIAKFPDDQLLCPVSCLDRYLTVSQQWRSSGQSQLLLAVNAPHAPVSTSTVSRWLKDALKLCGVDASTFSGHSTRSTSASAAAESGVNMQVVLAAGDWSGQSTFLSHYRPQAISQFACAVLRATQADDQWSEYLCWCKLEASVYLFCPGAPLYIQ